MNDKAYVFNIQHYSLHDGPGIRTNVFLKGCPLKCKWCSNPESQNREPEIFYNNNKCIGCKECSSCIGYCENNAISFDNDDKAVINRDKCSNCLRCSESCPTKAISIQGKLTTIKEILDIVEKDSAFYTRSDGGITISGGEPLMQGEFTINLLKQAKRRRINTAIETCGYSDYETLKSCAENLDTILFDIKSLNDEKHREFTGVSNKLIIENFEKLCRDFPKLKKHVRTPVIPSFNDNEKDIQRIIEFLQDKQNVSYELLAYHKFGEGKYKSLGREYLMSDLKLDQSLFEVLNGYTK
jgi:pyruvate formate lyase activating enzyme